MVNLQQLINDAKCFAVVRELRWPDGVRCPSCGSGAVKKRGFQPPPAHRQRHECRQPIEDLSGTIWEGHHQELRVWVLCPYLMGLNLSNEQMAAELALAPGDAQALTSQLRQGIVVKKSQSN